MPTHRPMIRVDRPDVVFTHREAKERAVVEEIQRAHATGRPVLVGTLTVEESERLAARLREAGVACQVLNARNDVTEATVIARAGSRGAVTIATNMAGRGTDIRLGGEDGAGPTRWRPRRPLCDWHQPSREPPRGSPAPGPRRTAGRSGRVALLRQPGRRSAGALRHRALIAGPRRHREARRTDRSSGDARRDRPGAADHRRQNFEIRRTSGRYASVLEEQRREVMTRARRCCMATRCLDVVAAGAGALGRAGRRGG